MRYKPDWPDAQQRLTALWNGDRLDRPCLAVRAPNGAKVDFPPPPADPRDRWLSPDWVLAQARAAMGTTCWAGEAIPSHLLMAGWIVGYPAAAAMNDRTIWLEPVPIDLERPPDFRLDPTDANVRAHERLYVAAAEAAGWDDFLVGQPCLLPPSDLLANMLGAERFLVALIDHPEWIAEALGQIARAQMAERARLRERIRETHRFWYGNAGWMPFWAPRPYASTQSDVSCMMSPEMFDRFVLPELKLLADFAGALWYHLDGCDARQHLPTLLSLPQMRVIQYVARPGEPPNGMGQLPLYRQIQAAGRIVHVQVAPANIEALVKALDPSLLMIQTHVKSVDEADELLSAAKRWV